MGDELLRKIKNKKKETSTALIEGRFPLPEDFDQIALVAWQKMIHEIFLDKCPCQTKAEDICLLDYEPQDLVEKIGDCLFGFKQFLDLIKEAEIAAQEIIFKNSSMH